MNTANDRPDMASIEVALHGASQLADLVVEGKGDHVSYLAVSLRETLSKALDAFDALDECGQSPSPE